tara:strand:- start:1948 stop:2709 length:762 start_codon:yes stop_codon:yes gene_type:complete
MLKNNILKFEPLHEGVLIKRYKRFLADIELDNGEIVTAHCANTGPMKGVLFPNGRVRLRYSPSPSRKLSWTWEQAEVISGNGTISWVGVNTSLPNKLIRIAIKSGFLKEEFGDLEQIKQEVVYGSNRSSRIDLLLTPAKTNPDSRSIYVEVKNTTWTKGSLALFPDTITTRGQKHLKELMKLTPRERAVLIPCISRDDAEIFAPGDSADEEYGNLFRKALGKGVEVLPCCFSFYRDCITWKGKRTFQEREQFS